MEKENKTPIPLTEEERAARLADVERVFRNEPNLETAPAEPPKKKKHFSPLLAALIIAVAAAGLLFGVYRWFTSSYAVIGRQIIARDAEEIDLHGRGFTALDELVQFQSVRRIDLRGNGLTPAQYDALRGKMPECEILWDVPIDGTRYDCGIESLELEDIPADWENLKYLPALRSIHVAHCSDPDLLLQWQALLPHCEILWEAQLCGSWYSGNISSVTLSGENATAGNMLAELPFFRSLTDVTLDRCDLSLQDLIDLKEAFPDITFIWISSDGNHDVSEDGTAITFPGGGMPNMDSLEKLLEMDSSISSVDFTGCALTAQERLNFANAHPELNVSWTVTIHGQTYPWDTELLDLNNVQFEDTYELEMAFPELPLLKQVELCDCGLSNEALDDLNRRFPDIKVVWRIYFSSYNLRTDAQSFIAAGSEWNGKGAIGDEDTYVLRYCTEMRALDCGHEYFSDLSFLTYMPHMTYLILAECPIYDISPLAELKELKYLEIFSTHITDLSPLLGCTALSSLNICYIDARQDNAYSTLSQMTWLNRLWYCGHPLRETYLNKLKAALPNCTFFMLRGGESSGGTWRYHEDYYEMRDAFGMYYMPGGTNGQDEEGNQIIIDDWGQEWHLVGWDGGPRWWEEYPEWDIHIIGITD